MDMPDIQTVMKKPITIQLNVRTYLKDDVHIARCEELKISDQGHSEEDAVENLANTLVLYIATCRQHGTLRKILKNGGVVHQGLDGAEEDLQDVPIPILKWERTSAG